MNILSLIILLLQLAIPFLVIRLILRTQENRVFWMSELFDMLRDENIISRHRTEFAGASQEVNGVIHTSADQIFYNAFTHAGIRKENIRFNSKALSFDYEDESLVAIVFDRGGPIGLTSKEQNAGKHLLGIVNREVQLAKPRP